MARIVLTHGRGLRHRDRDKLRDKFTWFMRQGLEDAGYERLDDHDVAFIYYGDVLERAEDAVAAASPAGAGLAAAGAALGVSARRFVFEDDADELAGQLADAGSRHPRVCTMVEERASRQPIAGEGPGEAERRSAVNTALEDRANQLLGDPEQLQSVLRDRFGSDTPDDETVTTGVRDLRERLGDDPQQAAATRAKETTGEEKPGTVDSLLRDWIVTPVTDAVAAVMALGRVLRDHGVDVRRRLSDWQRDLVSTMLTRFEGTDFGREWATAFDLIAVLVNHTRLDGFYIVRWMQDVDAYFHDATIRDEVRGLFRDVLRNGEEPIVLVAHSLGSVIAYDALREFPELDVCGLVTLGSPLSIDYFRERLARDSESKNALPVPETLDEWVNVYSEMDPLALGSGIARWFAGGGDEAGRGPVDRAAENTGYLDAHNPDQYLRSSVTAAAIVSMIGMATVREGFAEREEEDT